MGIPCVHKNCNRDNFDTEHAMKIHHYQSHGESIAKETTQCRTCESEFTYYPEEKPGIYCPTCVADDSINTRSFKLGNSEYKEYPTHETDLANKLDSIPDSNNSPKLNGRMSETEVIASLTRLGIPVSTPVVDGLPYDLIADLGTKRVRVQVKHARLRDGKLNANLTRTNPNANGVVESSYKKDEIDAYALYSSAVNMVYWVWFEEAAKTEIQLRIRGNLHPSVRWEDEYRIEKVLNEYITE